jgi:DNA processing protein
MSEHNSLAAWIRLSLTEGVGPQTARDLLSRFGLPENIVGAGFPALQKCVPEKIAYALSGAAPEAMQAQIERTLAWASTEGNHVLTLADDNYPKALLNIADPPPLLYAKGRIALLSRPALAIVGSRHATVQGMQNAERFAQTLSASGLTVVSGLALGIDAAAHIGALAANALAAAPAASDAAGSTVAITGTGLDLVYPARHHALAHRIAVEGCLISEYPLGTQAIASNFPRRNRLISGLAMGVLVVEAALQSGSLITARSATEQGRDVFAIPGSIHSPLSKGCHSLIRQGAKLVESAHDIMEELRWQSMAGLVPAAAGSAETPAETPPTKAASSADGAPAAQLLALAGHDPVSIDQLVERSGLPAAEVQAALLTLEMQLQIEMLPGGYYQRLA